MLSIIIVNYNSSRDIHRCLDSIIRHEKNYAEYEFIIVDNDSHDPGLESLRKTFPFVRIIFAEKNGGFAYGNNIGISNCHGSHILLLNPDTYLADNSIDLMYRAICTRSDIDIIGPLLLFPDGRNQSFYLPKTFPTVGRVFCEQLFLHRIFSNSRIFNSYYRTYMDYEEETEVEQISGAALLFTRKVIDSIGHLDENYFLYFEESDFCYRAVMHGFKLLYYPRSRIIHAGGLIAETNWEWSTRHYIQSFKYYFKKNYGSSNRGIAVAIHIAGSFLRCLAMAIRKKKTYRYHALSIARLLNIQ